MANRYSNISTSNYNPASMQELMLLPGYKRQQHDALEKQASELGLIESNRLDVDSPLVDEAVSGYENEVKSYIDELSKKGFSPSSKRGVFDLANKRKNLLSEQGVVGSAQKNYDAYVSNLKDVEKMYQTGKINKNKYERGIAKALQDYTGVADQGQYKGFNPVIDTDPIEEARKVALDMQKNPKIMESFDLKKDPVTGRYYDIKTQTKYTEKDAIKLAIKRRMQMDPNIMSDLKQREELGLLGGASTEQYLDYLGSLNESMYGKNQTTTTLSGFYPSKKEDANISESGNIPYVLDPVESRTIREDSFIDNIRDFGSSKEESVYEGSYGMYDTPTYSNKKVSLQDKLNENEQLRYDNLKSLLTKENIITDTDTEEDKALKISNYLTEYKDVAYSNPIVKPLSSKGKLSSALLLDTTDINKTNREIKNEINGGRTKLWDKKGNPIEVPEDFEVEYIGYISPSNLLPKFKNGDSKQSIAPHMIQIKDEDGKIQEVYASRSSYELDKPEFKAYEIIKNTIKTGIDYPGLPVSYEVEKNNPISKFISEYEVKYDPRTKNYNIKLYNSKGELKYNGENVPEDRYQNIWHEILSNSGKYNSIK